MGLAAVRVAPMVERGEGEPLVLLHGYPLDHRIWEAQLAGLSAGHRVLAPDFPGYGRPTDRGVPDTLGGFSEFLREALANADVGPAVVIGHSFGGYVALQLYRDHPDLFRGLALVSTRSEGDSAEAREKRLATIDRLARPGERLDIDSTVKGLFAPSTIASGSGDVSRLREMVGAVPVPTVTRTLSAIANRPDLSSVLGDVRVPTLVVWGEDDQLIPPAQTRSMVGRIPGGEGVGVAGAGHLPMVEQPAEFNRVLEEFLDRHESE